MVLPGSPPILLSKNKAKSTLLCRDSDPYGVIQSGRRAWSERQLYRHAQRSCHNPPVISDPTPQIQRDRGGFRLPDFRAHLGNPFTSTPGPRTAQRKRKTRIVPISPTNSPCNAQSRLSRHFRLHPVAILKFLENPQTQKFQVSKPLIHVHKNIRMNGDRQPDAPTKRCCVVLFASVSGQG
jgi:hypothetical protein